MKTLSVIPLLVVAAMSLCLVPAATGQAKTTRPGLHAVAAATGARMPDFCLDDLNGHPVCSSQFQGKVLLIDFWASWCGPCKTEMPAYQAFQERYGSRGLVVIGIGLSMDSPANLKMFARKLGVHYRLLMGTMSIQDKFGLKGIPTTLLVDRNRVIRRRIVGFDYPSKFTGPIQRALSQ